MSPSEVVGAEMTSSVPTPTATPPVMKAPDRLTGELDSIAVILAAKFPTCPPARVRDVVYETYRRLAAAARVRVHLIPLTANLSRSQLEREMRASQHTASQR